MKTTSAALIIGLAFYVSCFPVGAMAQPISDGRTLKERCATFQFTNPSAGLGCRGYVGAVIDILAAGNTIEGYRACPPKDATREDLLRSVKSWLSEHPV